MVCAYYRFNFFKSHVLRCMRKVQSIRGGRYVFFCVCAYVWGVFVKGSGCVRFAFDGALRINGFERNRKPHGPVNWIRSFFSRPMQHENYNMIPTVLTKRLKDRETKIHCVSGFVGHLLRIS